MSHRSRRLTREPGLAHDVHASVSRGAPVDDRDVHVLETHVGARGGGTAFDVDDCEQLQQALQREITGGRGYGYPRRLPSEVPVQSTNVRLLNLSVDGASPLIAATGRCMNLTTSESGKK